MRLPACALSLAAALVACAPSPETIQPSYFSSASYRSLSCDAIQAELARASATEADLVRRQSNSRDADAALLTVGLVVFWPALLGMAVTHDFQADIARVRGQSLALRQAQEERCSGTLQANISPSATVQNDTPRSEPVIPAPSATSRQFQAAHAWPVGCPPDGTAAAFSDGSTELWGGSAEGQQSFCLLRSGSRRDIRGHGIVDTNGPSGEAFMAALRPLFDEASSVPIGRSVEFSVIDTLPSGLTRDYRERWTVAATEQLDIAAGSFQTIVLQRDVSSMAGPAHGRRVRYWLDTSSGVIVKRTVDLLAGTTGERGRELVRISTPRQAPP